MFILFAIFFGRHVRLYLEYKFSAWWVQKRIIRKLSLKQGLSRYSINKNIYVSYVNKTLQLSTTIYRQEHNIRANAAFILYWRCIVCWSMVCASVCVLPARLKIARCRSFSSSEFHFQLVGEIRSQHPIYVFLKIGFQVSLVTCNIVILILSWLRCPAS